MDFPQSAKEDNLMKPFLLLLICLLCCLCLTACYVDNDPWPASAPPVNDVTAVPEAAPTPETIYVTVDPQPIPAQTPPVIPAEEAPAQPTAAPESETPYGING